MCLVNDKLTMTECEGRIVHNSRMLYTDSVKK